MSIPAYVAGFQTYGYTTETAGTNIEQGVPGEDGRRLGLINMATTGSGTAHTAYLMYADGEGTRINADGDAASGQKVLDVDEAPKDPAGNAAAASDIIAYKLSDGTWEFNTVASLSTQEITLTNNIGSPGVDDGAPVRIFGVSGDGANFRLALSASSTDKFGEGELYVVHPYLGDPMYIDIGNATNAHSLDHAVFVYMNK